MKFSNRKFINRKQIRKNARLQKKKNRAAYALNKNNVSNIPSNFTESKKALSLENGVAESNGFNIKFEKTLIRSKKKKTEQSKIKKVKRTCIKTNSSEGIQFTDTLSERMVKLQEYVNNEVEKNSVCSFTTTNKKSNFLKDKKKLQQLQNDNAEDKETIRKLSVCLGFTTKQKNKMPEGFKDFEALLDDIKQRTTKNSGKYNDDDVSKDLEKVLHNSDSLHYNNSIEHTQVSDDDSDGDDVKNLFDLEAEETDMIEEEESENELIKNEEKIYCEGGSCIPSSFPKGRVNNSIDLYSSDSDDDENLEGFVVGDDEPLEYIDASDELPDNEKSFTGSCDMSDSEGESGDSGCVQRSKKTRIKNETSSPSLCSNIFKRKRKDNITDNTICKQRKKRIRIESESSANSVSLKSKVTTKYNNISPKIKKKKKVQFCISDSNISSELKEDIYGRLREDNGNILSTPEQTSSISLKLQSLEFSLKYNEKKMAISRKLKGLLNRLAESNLAGISSQIENIYSNNSKSIVNECLLNILMESLIKDVLTPERLMQEHAVLISVLSASIGHEVGAYILTECVVKWEELDQSKSFKDVEVKKIDNILYFITNLYNFRIVGSKLIYDILQTLLDSFKEKEIELILMILKSVGFSLRKDNPLALKAFITDVQNKACQFQVENREGTYTRVKFMLEVLQAIKNNNMNKVPNYDPSHVEHLKKLLKGIVQENKKLPEYSVSLDDLRLSKERGRWWLIGSAWNGGLLERIVPCEERKTTGGISLTQIENDFTEKFRKKAEKLKLSRPPRINILYIITEGCEDYSDAYEKLIKLNLPLNQVGDIFSIILLCCQKGKFYNSFYSVVCDKLAKHSRHYSQKLKFAVKDKLEYISIFKAYELTNLAKIFSHLICEDSINISILKFFSFIDIDQKSLSFMRQLLISVLLHPCGSSNVENVFTKLGSTPKLKILKESIKLFIARFLQDNCSEFKEHKLLSKRVEYALNILAKNVFL